MIRYIQYSEGSSRLTVPVVTMPIRDSLALNVVSTASFCIITMSWRVTNSAAEHGQPTDPTEEDGEDDIPVLI